MPESDSEEKLVSHEKPPFFGLSSKLAMLKEKFSEIVRAKEYKN